MKSGEFIKSLAISLLAALSGIACNSGSSGDPVPASAAVLSSPAVNLASPPVGSNVMPVTVNGSLCGGGGAFYNDICVSVTICKQGTSNCQTVDNILLDTGSYGLRVFNQAFSVPLDPVTDGSGHPLANCVGFLDGSADWGPVKWADLVLGGESPVTVPIQVIDSTFGTVPGSCGIPETDPGQAGFNGILGVGQFVYDCGSGCVTDPTVGRYFSCTGSTCSGTVVPLAQQVQNPVTSLGVDNNGVILELPSVPATSASSAGGVLVLGIGTQSNNMPSGVTTFPADSTTGNFQTIFNGHTYSSSFIDSGSNGLFFPVNGLIANCSGPYNAWLCPASETLLTATNRGTAGSPSGVVHFEIGNYINLANSGGSAFENIGGDDGSSTQFDWGLPFFFGKKVYVGIKGKASVLGTGPYWAY